MQTFWFSKSGRVLLVALLAIVSLPLLSLSCGGTSDSVDVGERMTRQGDEIMVAGELIHTGTKVVLWFDPGGYDAYRAHRHFEPDSDDPGPTQAPHRIARFGSFRRNLSNELAERVRRDGWKLEDLQQAVSQVVIHFDACGTSRRCFQVLHDIRGLSCHFMLDADGTIYQTLDLKERAWHAAQANDRSVGIEIAHIGARKNKEAYGDWYQTDEKGLRVQFPESLQPTGLPDNFIARPSRQDLFADEVNEQQLVQYDFTEEQYAALENLLTALCRTFPKIKARAPLDEDGEVSQQVFPNDGALHAFEGLIGHHHVSKGKVDPGPAFDWKRILNKLADAGIPKE